MPPDPNYRPRFPSPYEQEHDDSRPSPNYDRNYPDMHSQQSIEQQTPQLIVQSDNSNKDWKNQAANWLFGQPAIVVLLFVTLGCTVFGMLYIVPQHLTTIQNGYEKFQEKNNAVMKDMNDENNKAHKSIAEQHSKDVEKMIQSFDKAMDKNEKAFSEGYRAAISSGKD